MMLWLTALIAADAFTYAASQPVATTKMSQRGGKSHTFDAALDDLLLDVRDELAQMAIDDISPLSLAGVYVSSNLSGEVNDIVVSRLTPLLVGVDRLRVIACTECFAARSEVQGGEWVTTRGFASREAMKRIGETLGVKTFLIVHVEFLPGEDDTLAISMRLIRAATGAVLHAQRMVSHETRGATARDYKKSPQTDADRREELTRMLRGEPKFGHNAQAGFWSIPVIWDRANGFGLNADDRANGAFIGYRIYEQFGPFNNSFLYGFQINLFIAPQTPLVFGGAVTALFGGTIRFENTIIPMLRFAAQAGAFIAGPAGSTFIIGPVAEVITRLRIGLIVGAQYFAPGAGQQAQLNGFGFNFGLNYVAD